MHAVICGYAAHEGVLPQLLAVHLVLMPQLLLLGLVLLYLQETGADVTTECDDHKTQKQLEIRIPANACVSSRPAECGSECLSADSNISTSRIIMWR